MNFTDIGANLATGGLYGVGKGMGFFGGGSPNFSGLNDLITKRQQEIDEFSNQLEMSRNNVLNNYQNLQQNTMKRFMPMMEAQLAGRGLTVGSGAYASALAKESVGMQGQYDMANADMTQKNLYDVQGLRASLFGPQFGLATQRAMIPYQNRMGMQSAFGQLAGTAAGSLFGPMGSSMGGTMGRSLFGGSGGGMSIPGMGGYGGFNAYSGSMRNQNSWNPSMMGGY